MGTGWTPTHPHRHPRPQTTTITSGMASSRVRVPEVQDFAQQRAAADSGGACVGFAIGKPSVVRSQRESETALAAAAYGATRAREFFRSSTCRRCVLARWRARVRSRYDGGYRFNCGGACCSYARANSMRGCARINPGGAASICGRQRTACRGRFEWSVTEPRVLTSKHNTTHTALVLTAPPGHAAPLHHHTPARSPRPSRSSCAGPCAVCVVFPARR